MEIKSSLNPLTFWHPSLIYLIDVCHDELSDNGSSVPREYCCNIVGCFDFRNFIDILKPVDPFDFHTTQEGTRIPTEYPHDLSLSFLHVCVTLH